MRYHVYYSNENVPLTAFDKLTFCINTIWSAQSNSGLSWREFFKENPMLIRDTVENKIIWSTKYHWVINKQEHV